MTREKFTKCLDDCNFRKCYEEEELSLYERGGLYLFLFNDCVSDSRNNPSFSIRYCDITLVRSRRGSFEIETFKGESVTLSEEEEDEIGCMG